VHVARPRIGCRVTVTRSFLVVGAAFATLLIASAAFGARGFSDPGGDTNTAPDLTSLEIAEASAGTIAIKVIVANYQALPANSWFNLWFDVDANASTGDDAGDEALVRYQSTGAMELYTWNGAQYVAGSTAGAVAAFTSGTLTLSIPRTSIHASGAFGVLAVGSRGQPVADEELVASDFVPNAGRARFSGPDAATFPDATGDHDAAPDLTAVRVSDARNGWITFSMTTPNYAVLPEESAIVISIDADNNPRTGESGTELQLSLAAGQVALERWDGEQFVPDDLPTRARHRNTGNVVALDLHVSELDNSSRFRFSLLSADVNTATQSVVAVDVAPDDLTFWRYSLANRPALRLSAKRFVTTPGRPLAGKPFAIDLPVTRSDTGRAITSGAVSCRVLAAEKRVAAKGSVVHGAGRCAFVVPASARGKVLRGTVTVRTGGKSVAADFSYVVR
jgi:hypothetical protein